MLGYCWDMLHALSFDLEEWYHADLLAPYVPPGERVSQVCDAVRPIIDLLRRVGVRATFFTVGEVARDHPDLIAELAADGHEIACHTMTHPNLWRLSPTEFQDELAQYRAAIDRALPGQQVLGFRAPMFSLDRRSHWVLGMLRDAGFRYDSSVVPVRTPWYGIAGAPLGIYRASLDDPGQADSAGGFLEFPLTVCSIGPLRIPTSGGVYLRLIPYPVFHALLRRVARRRPFVIYVHPWETYAATPRYPLPFVERFGLYTNIRHARRRLERLLHDFSFAPVREVLDV
jgi:polysaccharide deacetylase family protein (PEP-CTERM system associated)